MNHETFELLCPLYVLNLLDQAERELLETHLQTRCSLCQQRLREISATTSLLPYMLPAVAPPPSLKQKLIDQIQAEMEEKVRRPTQYVKRFAERTWRPASIPGVEFQHLWSSHGRSAWLFRSLSEATVPPHRHSGPELVYILEGNAIINGNPLTAGDFFASDPGSVDREVRCEPGCMFLLITNDDNEFL